MKIALSLINPIPEPQIKVNDRASNALDIKDE